MRRNTSKRESRAREASGLASLGGLMGEEGSVELLFTKILPNDAARVDLLLKGVVNDVPVVKATCEQKSEDKATKFREEGNTYYRKKDKEKALLLYTQSISLAPTSSQTLPFAFANRAVVLKDMGFFADSIADNQRALKTGYPEGQVHKLYLRQGSCYQALGQEGRAIKSFNEALDALEGVLTISEEEKEKLRMSIESQVKYFDDDGGEEKFEDLTGDKSIGVLKFDVPSLGTNVNPEIPTAADCIALKYNKTYGRHLVATRDIEPGEVLIVEEPFAAFLDPSHCFSHCNHCFKLCHTLLPCQHCAWAMFCSEACIEESRSYHQLECAMMPGFLEVEKDNCVHFAARLVTQAGFASLSKFFKEQNQPNSSCSKDKRKAGFNKDGKYDSADLKTIANLCYHEPRNIKESLEAGMMAAKLMKMLEFTKLKFDYDLGGFLMKLFSSLTYNGNGVTEYHTVKGQYVGDIKPLGASIFPTFALINHSCVGNTFYHFYGKTLVLRAAQLIKQGSQIYQINGKSFIKYSKQFRQEFTLKFLHFQCKCEACVGNWPTQEGILPAPSYHILGDSTNDALEVDMSLQIMKSLTMLIKKGIGNPQHGWRVEEHSLPLFINHLKLMDKFGKSHCMQYYMIKECVRLYYNMLGNHVGKPEDDGLEYCGDDVALEIQTINLNG